MCKAVSDRAGGSSGSDEAKKQPEAGQFDSFDSYMCQVTIGEELPEAMVVVNDFVGEAEHNKEKWLGDTGSSHHIKSTRAEMIDVENCPPGTKIRQVQGDVDVKEWGTMLLEVDGANGKRIMKLHETLIVPSIKVNVFSLQRVISKGYLPVYGEVEGKCLIKKRNEGGDFSQVATMTIINGRSTLDCQSVGSYRAKVEGPDLVEELPGEDDPPPLANGDGSDGGGSRSGEGPLSDVNENKDVSPEPEGVQVPRMSARENRGVPPLRLLEIMTDASKADDGGAPASYGEALNGPEGNGWKKAFDAEVKSLNDNKVYSVVDKPVEKKAVKAQWVFRRKLRPGGKLYKLKTRIVAEKPVYHVRFKHIKAKWHFIRKRVEFGLVKLVDARTEHMGADKYTKAVGPAVLAVNMRLIGMFKCG